MSLLRDARVRNSLIVVIVAVLALFGIEISEAELSETLSTAIELIAVAGAVFGSVSAIRKAPPPEQPPEE